jgi:transcriptional regulator with XRE-family HTH domain
VSMANTKQIDLKSVEELASLGLTDQQIADSLGISRSTLSRRKTDDDTFDTALRKGKAQAIVKVSNALMAEVEKGSLRAIIFYLKCRAGWREEEPEVREIPPMQIVLDSRAIT